MRTVRTVLWACGLPARTVLIGLIRLYRLTFAGMLGGQCRYLPSCSQYAEDAVRAHGAVRGSAMAVWRVLRCNPWARGGLDPAQRPYDGVSHGRSA